ncbi:MAG TPA: glycosyltransferase family 9 protein [Bryobacteraceae bacterium]|jgi:lipopolysaccharide heptosyltransferase I|nr:glycosyltransferase family 9 protein [Bryobacteraceae bacterium]
MVQQRILIVRLGAFGDILHTLPAAATVRENLPQAHITWMVEPRWLPLLEGNPYVNELFPFDRHDLSAAIGAVRRLRASAFDLAIDFQGLIKSALPSWLSGAHTFAGYSRQAARESIASLFYSRTVSPTSRHVVEQHLELATFATGPKRRIEFPIPQGWEEGALPSRFVLACPLAGWGAKQWPMGHYAELARLTQTQLGLPLVLNGSPAQEAQLRSIPGATVHLSGIPGLIDATRRATAVIGLDSGPLHLAAALRKPGVALFGPTDPARNGPYCDTISVLRDPSSTISYRRTATLDAGLSAITPAQVLEALRA